MMFNDDVMKTTLLKALAMLLIVAAKWWAMQPYHEPLLPKLYQLLARLCYGIARRAGIVGLKMEYNYYEAVS